MSFNPYEPPSSAYDGAFTNLNNGNVVSERVIAALRKSRPWVVLLGVLALVFGGLTVIGGLVAMTEAPGLGFVYVIMAALYVLPGIAMVKYGNAINKLIHGGGGAELEEAMDAQASFWQISGIIALVGLVLFVIGMVAAVAIGASMMQAF